MMSRLLSAVRRRPIVTFFLLAYALSWWPSIFYAFDLLPQPIAGFGPFLAAVLVLAITSGKTGIVRLLRRMVQWRGGFGWYAGDPFLPLAITPSAAACTVLLGAHAPAAAREGGG